MTRCHAQMACPQLLSPGPYQGSLVDKDSDHNEHSCVDGVTCGRRGRQGAPLRLRLVDALKIAHLTPRMYEGSSSQVRGHYVLDSRSSSENEEAVHKSMLRSLLFCQPFSHCFCRFPPAQLRIGGMNVHQ